MSTDPLHEERLDMIGKMFVFLSGVATGAWALASYSLRDSQPGTHPASRTPRARKSPANGTRRRNPR